MTWLTPEVAEGVCGHMNDDHAEAALAKRTAVVELSARAQGA